MSAGLSATGSVANEVFALLRETDPARWTDEVAEHAKQRWARIREGVERAAGEPARPALGEALANLATVVRESSAADEAAMPKSYWMALRARLMPAYERLAAQLRAEELKAPTLRPTNWSRIAFHVSSALGALLLLEVVLTKSGTLWATGAFAGTCWVLETTRALSAPWNERLMQVRFFKRIIHPHEVHRVNSATWYGTALFILALFSPPIASATALAVLGFGDPAAGLIGRRWGKHPIAGGRTLEGTVAFAFFGALAALGVLSLWHPVAPLPLLAGVAIAAAIAGAVAELVSRRVDDNFSVPLAAAGVAWLAALALSVPL
jgi:dolichol kinase